MKNRIITISREFGSGGRTIGRQAAEKLGIPCYDAELIQKLAEESGFAESYIKEAGEYTPHGFLSLAFSNRVQGPTNEDIGGQIGNRHLDDRQIGILIGAAQLGLIDSVVYKTHRQGGGVLHHMGVGDHV